jgi:hypothetical protein
MFIKTSFDKISVKEHANTISGNDKIAVIEGGNSLEYTPETILEIAQNIKTLRNEIIQ